MKTNQCEYFKYFYSDDGMHEACHDKVQEDTAGTEVQLAPGAPTLLKLLWHGFGANTSWDTCWALETVFATMQL